MKKEEELCEGRCTRWWLNREDSTDLWFEELLLYDIDWFTRNEMDWDSLARIGSHTEPRTEYGCMGGGVMMRMLGSMGCQLRVRDSAQQDEPCCQYPNGESLHHTLHRLLSKSRCLYRLLFLNPRDGFLDFLLGEKATLDVFLHAPRLIDEHAYG